MNNNYIKVNIIGKNVNNYLKWLMKQKINIANINVKHHNELEIIINYQDYKLLTKYSKTYKIKIVKTYGWLKFTNIIKKNFIMILCLIFAIILIYSLSHIIFSIDIIYNDQEIVNILKKELDKYDIKKFKIKKDTKYLEEVKKKILSDNKDILEWIEIEESGTKYIVKLVERKKETSSNDYEYQSIVATKDAIITSIKASSGEKVKEVSGYVKKGETIISGILTKPDGTNIYTKAKGTVYGEVWYKINVEYPLYYQEEKVTGRSKNVLSLYFLNKKISLFSYHKYKQFKLESESILENNLLPIKIAKERLYEVNIKEEIYTEETAIDKAKSISKDKLLATNKNIQEIKDIEILEKEVLNSKISLTIFASVIEDITKVEEIQKPTEEISGA